MIVSLAYHTASFRSPTPGSSFLVPSLTYQYEGERSGTYQYEGERSGTYQYEGERSGIYQYEGERSGTYLLHSDEKLTAMHCQRSTGTHGHQLSCPPNSSVSCSIGPAG